MKICYFGIYKANYNRNKVLMKGLTENNVDILECNSQKQGVIKYFDLIKKHWKIRKDYDVMIVGFPGWQCMILARFLTRKKIIFDAFFSIYDAMVCDRQSIKKGSWKAGYFWLLDWLSCRLADKILLDTNEHIKYFVDEFGNKKDKFVKVLIGTDENKFHPIFGVSESKTDEDDKIIVEFHGSFIPIQGIQYIIQAAKKLEKYSNIKFVIIGSGQKYSEMMKLFHEISPTNLILTGRVSDKELLDHIGHADICLGIFGNSSRRERVIPNKIYEVIAMKKALITTDTPAIRELFTDRKDIILCRAVDSQDLADKILELAKNKNLRNEIANNVYEVFKNNCLSKIIVKDMLDECSMEIIPK